MNYVLNNYSDELFSRPDNGIDIYAGNGLTVEGYVLQKDSSILVNVDDMIPPSGKHIITYVVVSGSVEMRIGEERILVKAGNSITVEQDENFSCWALETSVLYASHNCVEAKIDTSPKELVEANYAIEKNDRYILGHNYRVGKYATLLMQAIDHERSTTAFHMAAAYHDLGKAVIPNEIINKPGKLTEEEFEEVKKAPVRSVEILEPYIGLEAANFVRWHHEKLDGSGYPDGLKGDEIPLESRIIEIADIFDALTTDRSYRSAYSFRKALEIMDEEAAQGKLDIAVLDVLKSMVANQNLEEGFDNMRKDFDSTGHYDGFTIGDIRNALSIAATGMWKSEYIDDSHARLFGDEVMNELIGIEDSASPEARYETLLSRIHPEDKPVFESFLENLKREKSEMIFRYNHPERGLMYIRAGGKRDDSVTDKICYRGFHQNITGTVRIEQEKRRHLTEVAELYQRMAATVMENFTTSAMYIDLEEKNFTWLTCKELRLLGIERYGDVGRKYASYMPGDYGKQFLTYAAMDNLSKVLKYKDEYEFTVFVYDEAMNLRRITMKYFAVDEVGRYVLAVSQDTTDVYQREQKLAVALQAADKANKAKSIFLNNMSHDIRTPMNAIIGFKNLAEKHIDDRERCLDYLSKIGVSSDHLLSLINDVLDMSRIESGKIQMILAPASITEIASEMKTIFVTGAKEKGVDFDVIIEKIDNDSVMCDKLRVNQILLNCLSNAIKFTNAGGRVSLKVSQLESKTEGKGSYRFVVSDTGIGMSKEFQKEIFDPFTREEDGAAHQVQGTGLGMSICKSLVDMMGGNIEIESELGKGSTFFIDLPFEITETSENTAQTDAGAEEISLSGKRILLVEDNDFNREIATCMLEEFDATVETAENGAVAVEMISEKEPEYYDLVLMDVQMPVMNGYEATKAIRSLNRPDAKSLVIVAMTANAFEEDKKLAKDAGMNDHIAKPVEVGRLVEVLKQYS